MIIKHSPYISEIKKIIQEEVLIKKEQQKILIPDGSLGCWIFDFRGIFLKAEYLQKIASVFWDRYEDEFPFQVGGIESAAIPLITAISLEGLRRGKHCNAFYLRKERKPTGLQRTVEGTILKQKIIFVDDLINSGGSLLKLIRAVREIEPATPSCGIFTILAFRDKKTYETLNREKVQIDYLFTLDDFDVSLPDSKEQPQAEFEIKYHFKSPDPNYFYVVPKSTPALDKEKIYFGSDSGYFWALNQEDGTVVWKYKVGLHARGKNIFSSPAVFNDTVYFGAYDGNLYALDTQTGKRRWVFMEADWIGSSPAIATDLNLLFIGLEFGLFKKRGGIAAINAQTGVKKWEYIMPEYTHGSPVYIPHKNIVAIGCNNGVLYLFDAQSGNLLWKLQTDGEIKASIAYDQNSGLLIFGSFDHKIYFVNINTGTIEYTYKTFGPIFSTPCIYKDLVLVSSQDKKLYCIDIRSKKLKWEFQTSGRIFSSPVVIEGRVYVGSNDGIMYEIDLSSGTQTGSFQTTERITNAVAYNSESKRYFLPTFANEIYCLERTTQKI